MPVNEVPNFSLFILILASPAVGLVIVNESSNEYYKSVDYNEWIEMNDFFIECLFFVIYDCANILPKNRKLKCLCLFNYDLMYYFNQDKF